MTRTAKRIFLVLLFAVGLGYFLFTSFVFDPFEGSWMEQFPADAEVALEVAVPREVDFFAHKRGLESDFTASEFPVPDVWDDIRLAKSWQRFEQTPLAKELAESLQIGARIDEVRAALSEVPLLDPVADAFGRDFALFGRLKGFGYEQTEAAAVFLGTASMRFAWAVIGSSLLRSLFSVPLEVEDDDAGVRTITLPSGQVVYGYRHLDLFCVSTGPNLVREVSDLLRAGHQQSLGFARSYTSTVAQDVETFAGREIRAADRGPPVDTRLQLHGRLTSLFSLTEAEDQLLEPRGEISRWLLARLFNPRYFQGLTLDVGFPGAIELRGTLGFDRAKAEQAKTGFYNRKTFELRRAMDRAAAVLPDDVFFMMAARVDMKLFLPQIIDGLKEVDPAAVSLIDDLVSNIRKVRPDFRSLNASDAVKSIANFLGDDVVVAMKRDTYFGSPSHPSPIVCFFFEVTERGPTMDELKKSGGDPAKSRGYHGFVYPIIQAHSQLRAKGGGAVANWYNVWYETQGSTEERCIQDVILAHTDDVRNVAIGIIDPASKEQGPWQLALVLSPRTEKKDVAQSDGSLKAEDFGSAQEMVADIVKLHTQGNAARKSPAPPITLHDQVNNSPRTVRPLLRAKKYEQASEFLEGFASVAAFLDARGLKEVLADHADVHADAVTAIDWTPVAARLSDELMNGEFAKYRGTTLPPKVQEDFDYKLQQQKDAIERQRVEVEVPKARKQYLAGLAWVDLFEDAFLAARIDDKEQIVELRAKVNTTLR